MNKIQLSVVDKIIAISALFFLCISSVIAGHRHNDKPWSNLARTDAGLIRGVSTDYGARFLGVPYAAAPVGDLRWQSPQPAAPWDGVRDANEFGGNCAQPFSPFGIPSVSEDCLYLNVYQPKSIYRGRLLNRKRPVMVWIHGGAFQFGESQDFDPAKLAKNGTVVVTINYRLGALGFLAHPALSANSPTGTSGNYGIQDQQAALRWVQNNIANFGGDPNNVTIFGESAGGLSVHTHLASPESAGLFHRAIIQSGAYALQQPPLPAWEFVGTGIAAAMGCPDQSLDCLQGLSVEQILAGQDPGAVGYLPNVDGLTLPTTVLDALQTGQFNRVPVIQGSNSNEYSLFTSLLFELAGTPITPEFYPVAITLATGLPAEVVPLVLAEYPLENFPSPSEALNAVGTDFLFACNAQTSNRLLSQFVPTYAYEFADDDAPQIYLPPVSFDYGAYHAAEIQYVMDPQNDFPIEPLNRQQRWLSKQMVNYWTSFSRFGKPFTIAAPFWKQYQVGEEKVQSLQPGITRVNDFNQRHHCDFWGFLLGQ